MVHGWLAGTTIAAVLGAAMASADEAPVPAAPTLPTILENSGITASGYVAVSYSHSTGYPQNVHQFDIYHDSFELDQAGLTVAYQPKEGFGALVDVIAGEDARILHEAEDGQDETFDLLQAFAQYSTGSLSVIGGKFLALAGAEVVAPTGNANFSRSFLFFYSQPMTLTGVRATYAINDSLSVIAGVNNGWNVTSTSYGSKTGEAGIAWTPGKVFSMTVQGYLGKALPYDAERSLVDVVATYNATSALTFVANLDWNEQQDALMGGRTAKWSGIAGYANYSINEKWRVSLRAEYLDDADGFLTGTTQHLWEGTATIGLAPAKNFELRVEGRYDKAQVVAFYSTSGALSAAEPDATELTGFAIQGVYKF